MLGAALALFVKVVEKPVGRAQLFRNQTGGTACHECRGYIYESTYTQFYSQVGCVARSCHIVEKDIPAVLFFVLETSREMPHRGYAALPDGLDVVRTQPKVGQGYIPCIHLQDPPPQLPVRSLEQGACRFVHLVDDTLLGLQVGAPPGNRQNAGVALYQPQQQVTAKEPRRPCQQQTRAVQGVPGARLYGVSWHRRSGSAARQALVCPAFLKQDEETPAMHG